VYSAASGNARAGRSRHRETPRRIAEGGGEGHREIGAGLLEQQNVVLPRSPAIRDRRQLFNIRDDRPDPVLGPAKRNSGPMLMPGMSRSQISTGDDAIIKALQKGDTESLTHDPILCSRKRGDMIGVYSVVTLKDGAKVREFMDMNQLKKIQATSKTGDSEYGPWKKWFEESA
jgi:hypothetical protein